MNIKVNGKNVKITDEIHAKLKESLEKLKKYDIVNYPDSKESGLVKVLVD